MEECKIRTMTVISHAENKKKIQRVAAYCRVSTDKTEQEHSFLMQKTYYMKKYKNTQDYILVGIYTDTGSGTSSACRPGFQQMLNDCRKGKIDSIITKSLSRFARNTKECLETLRELKKTGITVLFEKESIDTARISDEVMITIMEGLAQEESLSISRNIRWSLKKKMADGSLGIARVPYGFIKSDNRIEIDQEKSLVVKRIFSLYLSGMGAKKIAILLNSENIPSPCEKMWNSVTILKILRQEKYIGDIMWQKTYSVFMEKKYRLNHGEADSYYIKDCLPQIISREDFIKAGQLRSMNTRDGRNKTESPFRKKTKCTCGRAYYLKAGADPTWECCGKYSTSDPCPNRVFHDSEYRLAWNRLCKKLRRYNDEIILPCIEMLDLAEKNPAQEEIILLRERAEEINRRKYVLCLLCSEGCITTEKLITLLCAIDSELEEINKQLSFSEEKKKLSLRI